MNNHLTPAQNRRLNFGEAVIEAGNAVNRITFPASFDVAEYTERAQRGANLSGKTTHLYNFKGDYITSVYPQ